MANQGIDIAPALMALGKAAGTEAGRVLFLLAYDSSKSMSWYWRNSGRYEGKRPSKASQEFKYSEGLAFGEYRAYAKSLAAMACEMSGGKVCARQVLRAISQEIEEIERTGDNCIEFCMAAPTISW